MAARLLSRVVFHLLLSCVTRTSVRQKTARNLFTCKNTIVTSYSDAVKARTHYKVLYFEPTSAREEGRDCSRKPQNGRCLFMVGGFALSSLGDKTPTATEGSLEVHLTPEQPTQLRDKNRRFARKKPTENVSMDKRTHGIREWRAKRKLDFEDSAGEWSPLMKRETCASQVWLKFYIS